MRATVDQTGVVSAETAFTAYGEPLQGTTDTFGFAGEQLDTTGLLHLRARQYNPGLGRFTTVDPVQPGAPGTTGYNLYTYAANNPTTFTDPTGQVALSERAFLGALAVGTTAYVALVLPQQLRSVLDQPLGGAPAIDIDLDLPDLERLTNEVSGFLAEQASTNPGDESQEQLNRDPVPPFLPNDLDEEQRTCATEYSNDKRMNLADVAAIASGQLDPFLFTNAAGRTSKQTAGLLFTCDRTTITLRTYAAGTPNFRSSQIMTARANQWQAISGNGHAEQKLYEAIPASEERLAVGTSNNTCSDCQRFLSQRGAILVPNAGAYWPVNG